MYYVIEIATGDTKIEGKAIYSYDTVNKAIATFHQKLGNAMKSELYKTELVMVIDDAGMVVKRERYDADSKVTEYESVTE